MRHYAFLETLTPGAQRALPAAFSDGAGHLCLLTRLQQADTTAAVILGTAPHALAVARDCLAERAG